MLETFGYVEELHQAVLACREVNPKIPIVAQVTIDEDGNCLDGSDPEAFARPADGVERGRARHQLQRGAGRDAGRDRAGASRHFPAPGRAAQRRHAAFGRRTKYLSLLAGVHGELHAQICGRRGAAGRRMLRNHARPHPRHEIGAAGGRSARQDGQSPEAVHSTRGALGFRPAFPWPSAPAWAPRLAAGEFVTMVEIVPPKGIDIRKEVEGAKFLKSVGRGRDQHPRQPARLGPHEQPGAVAADAAGRSGSKPSCTTPAATGTCSAFSPTCWGRRPPGSAT